MSMPLDGHRIGVTAARKADEQIALLHRRGATVLHAPCVEYVAAADDADLRAATAAITTADVAVVTTGMGLRGWLAAADGWGLRPAVLDALAGATVLARGPKAAGAVREAGLREAYTPPSETDRELLEHLLGTGVAGRHVVLQSHGEQLPAMTEPLRAAGATVTELLPYRWRVPADTAPMHRLLAAAAQGELAAVTFTSAPAATALLRVGGRDAVPALSATVVACVGDVTAKPLRDNGIDVLLAPRARTAALVRALSDRLAC